MFSHLGLFVAYHSHYDIGILKLDFGSKGTNVDSLKSTFQPNI